MKIEVRDRYTPKKGWFGIIIRLSRKYKGLSMPFKGKMHTLSNAHIQLFSDEVTQYEDKYMLNIVREFSYRGDYRGSDISQIRLTYEDLEQLRDSINDIINYNK